MDMQTCGFLLTYGGFPYLFVRVQIVDLQVLFQVPGPGRLKVANVTFNQSHGRGDLVLLLPVGEEIRFCRESLAANVTKDRFLARVVSGADMVFQIGLCHVPGEE